MRSTARLLSSLVAPLLVLSLAACGDDDPEDHEPVLSKQEARSGLLTSSDVGPGYHKQPAQDAGQDADNEGIDCLSSAARDFDAEKGVTEVEVKYRKEIGARGSGEVTVLSGISSYAENERAETALDDLRDAMLACETAEFEQDGATIRFDISVSEGRTADELDQQLNLELDGDITVGTTSRPLVVQLRYFRVGNHGGTVSVTLFDAPSRAGEVGRFVDLGVERFLTVVEQVD